MQGANFYRIIHSFIDQAGVYVESVFGGTFNDDPGGLLLKHTKKVSWLYN
jgi:peptidyl-prolyl isomerase D